MILGVGIELVAVKPFEAVLEGPDEAVLSYVSSSELVLIRSRRSGAESLAARVAARVAACKALGWDWQQVPLNAFVVSRLPSGQPVLEVQDLLRPRLETLGSPQLLLTLSHTAEHAVALVVVQTAAP